MPVNSEEIYQLCRFGGKKYKEEVHCPMIVEVMNNQGTMAAFCTQAQIGDSTFYNWMNKHPVFHECYRIGCMIARNNWEEEGEKGNITVEVKQFGGRFGKDTDGSDINDDGISHKKEGGLKMEVSYETLKTGTSKVYAKLV